jgi:periplasmic copper chaperone A
MKLRDALFTAAAATLILAPAATAHVTMNPDKAQADGFARFALRVPTEESVPTVKVSIQLPAGLDEVSFQTKPGWQRTKSGRIVTWSGGQIGVGEFDEFGVSIHLPNTPGKVLVFPATQTYANGKVMHWIGALNSEEPAPHVTPEAAQSNTTPTTAAARSDTVDEHDELAIGLASAGIAVALIAVGLALIRRRRA